LESQVQIILEPFVRRQLFSTTEEAARKLALDYVKQHIQSHQRKVARLERKYGMTFAEFGKYLRQRSTRLQSPSIKSGERKRLGRAIMNEEEDWLEWKAVSEMLESWLKLNRELNG